MKSLVRFGVSIEEKLLANFDRIIESKGYVNRSEAIRDMIRDKLVSEKLDDKNAECIGTLTLIYSHDIHELSEKLNQIQHHNHRIIITITHIHLDEHNCLEVLILRGKTKEIQSVADKLLSVKNVRHGKLSCTTTA
jgi:CopG family nickel-responsive transcriptional regulator